MDWAPWLQRLEGNGSPYIHVGLCADLPAALKMRAPRMPAAFIFPLDERSAPNEINAGGFRQLVTPAIGVLTRVRNVRQTDTGSAVVMELDAVRAGLMRLLLGWSPDESFDLVEHTRGRLVQFAAGDLAWMDQFTTEFEREREVPHA